MSRFSVHSLALTFAIAMAALSVVFVDHVERFTTILSIAGACAAMATALLMIYMDINRPPKEFTASFKSTLADWGSFWSGFALLLLTIISF